MFCPKCRSEFREGFTFCKSCNESLVDNLPSEPQPLASEKPLATEKIEKTFKVEKWLKRGAAVYIVVGILSDVANLFATVSLPGPLGTSYSGSGWTIFTVVAFFSAAVGSVLWGAFFYALGKIIELLEEGFGYERS